MEEKEGSLQISHYIELWFKHRWIIILPFCVSITVGIVLTIVLPKIYMASSLIIERPQRVPKNYVADIVTGSLRDRIDTISKQILSRTNLEKIINQFNLYMGPKHENMQIEDKIANLRNNLIIKTQEPMSKKKGKNEDVFTISYIGSEPKLVAPIVNSLAASFIEENLIGRETEAIETRIFLEDELKVARQQLEIVENKLKNYRTNHMGELPEQLETNLRMIDRLQMQLNQKYTSLRSTKDRLIILENQIEADLNIMRSAGEYGEGLTLPQLKKRLANLETSYTARHPDVIRTKAKIAEMEAKIESGEYEKAPQPLTDQNPYTDIRRAKLYNNQIQQKAKLESEIKNLDLDILKINNEIEEYKVRVENTPKLEQELMTLQRDYQNILSSYNSLQKRKLQADISVNMEKKQKGDRFEIIERARVPHMPFSPNLKFIFLATSFIALSLGGGLIFLIDYFDTSVKHTKDFDRELGITLLATIPKIYSAKDLRRQRQKKIMTAISLFVSACLFAGFTVITIFGPDPTVEFISTILNAN
jgi:polysaccharide chain length determinant protein (PEP-CTERM system associated)